MFKRIASLTIAFVMILSMMAVGVVNVGAVPDIPDIRKTSVLVGIQLTDGMTNRVLSPFDVIDGYFKINALSSDGSISESFGPYSLSDDFVHVSDNNIIWFDNKINVDPACTLSLEGFDSSGSSFTTMADFSNQIPQNPDGNLVSMRTRSYLITATVSKEITQSGNSKQSIVTLDYDTANLRVTVPSVLPVNVDSDNNVTVANNAKIVNHSNGSVDVTACTLNGNSTWSLVDFDTDFTKVPTNTKQYGFELLGYKVPTSGNAFNNQFGVIDGNAELPLTYNANVAIQSEKTSGEDIGSLVFTVAWHK